MAGPKRRVIDPTGPARNLLDRRMGGIIERDTRTEQRTQNRFPERQKPDLVTFALGPWFREDPPAASTGLGMRMLMPSAAAVYATTGTGVSVTQHRAGRVIGAQIKVSSDVTAGTLTVGVKISGGTTVHLSDCVLSTAMPRDYMVPVPWAFGIPFAALDTVAAVVSTSAAFAPTTLDVEVMLYVAYEAV